MAIDEDWFSDHVAEAQRWQRLVNESIRLVPELAAWLWDAEATTVGPGDVWWTIVDRGLDEDYFPRDLETGVWQRILKLVEWILRAAEVLRTDGGDDDDLVVLGSFTEAGVLCDLTRNRDGLERLTPWMGPAAIIAARREVEAHQHSRGWDCEAVDWSSSAAAFDDDIPDLRKLYPSP